MKQNETYNFIYLQGKRDSNNCLINHSIFLQRLFYKLTKDSRHYEIFKMYLDTILLIGKKSTKSKNLQV